MSDGDERPLADAWAACAALRWGWTDVLRHSSDAVMAFLTDPDPPRSTPREVHPGVRRLVAPNAGAMTYTGTNTWLVEEAEGLTVIDPGPDDAGHIAAIAAAGKVARIVLTHSHPDHMAGVPLLRSTTGAPVFGWGIPWAAGFLPDVALEDGAKVGRLTAIHTPGHASDHLCFALDVRDGVLFSGDHVMSWNTSIVSPPDGDMAAYMAGLRLLLRRTDRLYLCGHGAPLPEPQALVRAMLHHRVGREAAILGALRDGALTVEGLVARLYSGLETHLAKAAGRSVLAHLEKLASEGRVNLENAVWRLNGDK